MQKLVDIRCYVSPEHKRLIKQTALDRNTSVNKLLKEIICTALPEPKANLTDELENILTRLSNSANLPQEEREQLKKRKNEIKSLMKGVTQNGKEE